jgi:hypothetical protein
MTKQNISPDDAFAEMAQMRERSSAVRKGEGGSVKTVVTQVPPDNAAAKQSGMQDTVPNVPSSLNVKKTDVHRDEGDARGSREFLVGVYIDERMDDFLEHYVSQRIEGTRKKPSRSLVAFWLMQIGMQAIESQRRPAMPRELAKRRRQ